MELISKFKSLRVNNSLKINSMLRLREEMSAQIRPFLISMPNEPLKYHKERDNIKIREMIFPKSLVS